MIKLKLLFFSVLSNLFFLVTTSTVFADVYPCTNYEIVSNRVVKDINTGELLSFYTTELRDAYLESNLRIRLVLMQLVLQTIELAPLTLIRAALHQDL